MVGGIRDAAVKKAIKDGADLFEVRIDTFKKRDAASLDEAMKRLRALNRRARLGVILTVRSVSEGGRFHIPGPERAAIFDSLMAYADIVDIELGSAGIIKSVVDSAHGRGIKVIVSHHDFKGTPGTPELRRIIRKARRAGGDIVKIAAAAKDREDLQRLASLLSGSNDLIVIAMGRAGAASRVFFPVLGSLITYGSVTSRTAPGQPTLKVLKRELALYDL